MRVYELRVGTTDLDGLRQSERPEPKPTMREVLVRIRAASINSRDHAILGGKYFSGPVTRDLIPLSDGAGEVLEVGPDVIRFKAGDRVAGTFFQGWIDGPPPPGRAALGSPLDGVLAEYVVLHEDGVVAVPESLSFEEAATLPCAAVTAWNALFASGKPLRGGDTVLCLGTGGVSIAALKFAISMGAHVVITSSSDEKLSRARALGAHSAINYKQYPEWGKEILTQTDGRGMDHIVEIGGAATLRKSFQAVAPGGKIALIGALTGLTGNLSLLELMSKNASLHGVSVGPRTLFEELNRYIAANGIKPLIDKVFPFDDAHEAFRCHASGQFMGKIIITI